MEMEIIVKIKASQLRRGQLFINKNKFIEKNRNRNRNRIKIKIRKRKMKRKIIREQVRI